MELIESIELIEIIELIEDNFDVECEFRYDVDGGVVMGCIIEIIEEENQDDIFYKLRNIMTECNLSNEDKLNVANRLVNYLS